MKIKKILKIIFYVLSCIFGSFIVCYMPLSLLRFICVYYFVEKMFYIFFIKCDDIDIINYRLELLEKIILDKEE